MQMSRLAKNKSALHEKATERFLHKLILYKWRVKAMVLAIMFLVVAILSAIGGISSLKKKNFFAFGFSGVAVLVFGFFSIATIMSYIF